MLETKEEIATYDLGFELIQCTYIREIAVQSLEGGLDSYNILTKNPKVESIDGMDCVKYEMETRLWCGRRILQIRCTLKVKKLSIKC